MPADSAFWRDLEARFRELLNIPESARLTGMYVRGRPAVNDGPRDKRDSARLKELFASLARAGAVAAGVANRANGLDGWLNLLRAESPHFHVMYGFYKENGVDVHEEDGLIENLVLASAEYCGVRATRAFEMETAAAVAGVPALSDPTKRKLAVEWDTLREQHKITEEDISGYDRERRRILSRTPAPHGTPGILKRAAERADPQGAAHRIGLDSSVKAAEAWFPAIDSEYWSHWCSSGEPYETYAAWLDTLKRDTVAELESIWKGHSAVTDCWFRETCKPVVEKALSGLVKPRIAQARDVEMNRLDNVRAEAQAGAADALPKATPIGATEPNADESTVKDGEPPSFPGGRGRAVERSQDGRGPSAPAFSYEYPTDLPGAYQETIKLAIRAAGLQLENRPVNSPDEYGEAYETWFWHVMRAADQVMNCQEWNAKRKFDEISNFGLQAAVAARIIGPVPDGFLTITTSEVWYALRCVQRRLTADSDGVLKADQGSATKPSVDESTRTGAGPTVNGTNPAESNGKGRKRGRPQKISDDRKAEAQARKDSGGTNRDAAAILYETKYPTPQQVKNVSSLLRGHRNKNPKQASPPIQVTPKPRKIRG
jgi:hypothetical protein